MNLHLNIAQKVIKYSIICMILSVFHNFFLRNGIFPQNGNRRGVNCFRILLTEKK